MKTYRTVSELRQQLDLIRSGGGSVGFVPTMGALHQGHISLLHEAQKRNSHTLISIFVNPTQFNNSQDLEQYPRTLEADEQLLISAHCNFLFVPDLKEIYPAGPNAVPVYQIGPLGNVLEGSFRPGHFNGVVQVVRRLFEITGPVQAFFGLKDYQQYRIIKKMTEDLNLDVQIFPCPIIREPDGLAMSSRNTRLNTWDRKRASNIPRILEATKKALIDGGLGSWKEIRELGIQELESYGLKVEYLELCHSDLLSRPERAKGSIILIAAWCGQVRLIDNLLI